MWILEGDSDFLQGRRMWLKPGKSYLFGRVKKDGVRFAIDYKTVSRKHFIIKVENVKDGDVARLHARTKVTIEDQNSKAGTIINGETIKGSSRELAQADNYIKPGGYPSDLVIKWHSQVFTFNLLKKDAKSGVLQAKQEGLKELDIKVISEYVTGQTKYLVAAKRNTAKGLQALIDGTHIVTSSYVDALEYAATPRDLNEEENLSPLEEDFDASWPDPTAHLPPRGKEPTKRPVSSYQPTVDRKNIFDGFTFVFADQSQYDNLLPAITTGHGKALLYNITYNETTVDDFVQHLQNTAGRKNFGDRQDETDKGGVILVRWKHEGEFEDWTADLINQTSLKLDQRAIDQGEFLDAILANNASLLRQAVPYESNADRPRSLPEAGSSIAGVTQPSQISQLASSNGDSVQSAMSRQQNATRVPNGEPNGIYSEEEDDFAPTQPSQNLPIRINGKRTTEHEEPPRPVKRARFQAPMKSRVKDFDDGFDPDSIAPYDEDDYRPTTQASDQQPRQESYSSDRVDSELEDGQNAGPDSHKRQGASQKEQSARLDDDLDDLLPAAAVMKRRKLAAQGLTTEEIEDTEPVVRRGIIATKKPKKEKNIDVLEAARARREAEEALARGGREETPIDLSNGLPVYDVVIEEIDVPTHKNNPPTTNGTTNGIDYNDRWDPRWNGRKNFKGFRRVRDVNGSEDGDQRRMRTHTRIIVPLVDAKMPTHGIGDQYWERSEAERERQREKKRKASQRSSSASQGLSQNPHGNKRQVRSHTIHGIDSDENSDEDVAESTTGVDREQSENPSPEVIRLQREAAEIIDDDSIDIHAPRRTRATDSTSQSQQQSRSSGQRSSRPPTIPNGSSANTHDSNTAQKKTQRTLPAPIMHSNGNSHASESDDSDDMKFKFGSRARRGKGRLNGR